MAVMLAAGQRLRRSSDFAVVLRHGRRAGRGGLVVHLSMPAGPAPPEAPAPAGDDNVPARAGFVVSKAVGGAVVRNAVRRRLRHLVRERLPHLPAGTVLVVRALPAAASVSYPQLGADLDAALAAARVAGIGHGRRRRGGPRSRGPAAGGDAATTGKGGAAA